MIRLFALLIALSLLTGCAHTISITPGLTDIEPPPTASRSPKTVALYISNDLRNKEVTTPGGGGESVTYKPYQDLELNLIRLLKNNFASAKVLTAPPDTAELKRRGVDFLIAPQISTNSSSAVWAIWWPTDFTMTLQLSLVDLSSGATITKEVTGNGRFVFSEQPHPATFASESGIRAAREALLKMQRVLLEASDLR
ncbi:hypothetical protein NX774_22255 [Massilia agilis]|uniref:Lipoprotein n=1 Tax=Massilia agilis TaxID=1811226 RepID=A0ABT2DH60_9BURK|nr:hypothetical protein [Massilia agilis]MCS0810654.1 hypothetical protein [Massilia agilis]